jgi:hypothetical protein
MNLKQKLTTEKDILSRLKKEGINLPPLHFRSITEPYTQNKDSGFDAFLEAPWDQDIFRFAVECKALSTPKIFQNSLNWLANSRVPSGFYPLLIVSFLSETQLQELEKVGKSGIDLCGNGIVTIPGRCFVLRSGQENRFSSSAPIKNIYRKKSSMVGRAFLTKPRYGAVKEVLLEVNQRNILVRKSGWEEMSLPTVSKALKGLEEDLIIEKKDGIRLLQADKLLEKLEGNYVPPIIKRTARLKLPIGDLTVPEYFTGYAGSDMVMAATGKASANRYAVMPTSELFSVYCPDLDEIARLFPGADSDRFPNVEFLETMDETVFFDARGDSLSWASPVQAYLELMQGDKRDRETALQVKSSILNLNQ